MESIGTIYTLHEAAERLRMTPRMVCKIARAHGLCSRVGRNYLFSEADIDGIWHAQREATIIILGITRNVAGATVSSSSYDTLVNLPRNKKRKPSA